MNAVMDTWADGTLQTLERVKQPELTLIDIKDLIFTDIETAQDKNRVVHGRAMLKISQVDSFIRKSAETITDQASRIVELERDLQNTKVELAHTGQWCKNMHRDWKDPFTPAPAETVTEVTVEPVEWITIAEYAKRHGKAYSTVAGKKNDLTTRQDPSHAGRWQIDASSPYPNKQ